VRLSELRAREKECLRRQVGGGARPATVVVIYGTSGIQRANGLLSESVQRTVGGVDWVVNRLVCPLDPQVTLTTPVTERVVTPTAGPSALQGLDAPTCADVDCRGAGVYAVETARALPGTDCTAVYVGASTDRERRIGEHAAGGSEGCLITREYGVRRTIETLSSSAARPSLYMDELYEFLEQGVRHGFQRVRGAMYVTPTLDAADYRAIRLLVIHLLDRCGCCGREGHKYTNCTQREDPLPFLRELHRLGADPKADARTPRALRITSAAPRSARE
jgi:hypothetical protein